MSAAALSCTLNLSFVVASLLTPSRRRFVEDMRAVLPNLHVLRAVDGVDIKRVTSALQAAGVTYHNQCGAHRRWGMLACWLTRLHAFEWQVANRIGHMVLLEDDLALMPAFPAAVCREASALFSDCATLGGGARRRQRLGCGSGRRLPFVWKCSRHGRPSACESTSESDVLQMDRFGEVYVSSLEGARRVVTKLRAHGVRGCCDQQLNDPSMMNLSLVWSRQVHGEPRPWRLVVPTNQGDIGKTARLTAADVQRLNRREHGGAAALR